MDCFKAPNHSKEPRNVALIIYVVGFLDLFGVSLIIPLLTSHARSLGASPSVTGLLGSVYGGVQLFSSPVVGHWSDVSGRRYVLILCLLLSASGYALLACASSLLLLFLARLPPGLFKHSLELCRMYLAQSCSPAEHAQVFGRFASLSSVGFVVGPVIGGHLAEGPSGFSLVSSLAALIMLANVGIVWLFVPETETRAADHRIKSHSPIEVAKRIEWAALWDVFLVRFLLGCAVMVSRNNFPLLLEYKYAASPSTVGYIISYGSVISTIGGWFVGRIADIYNDDMRLLKHAAFAQSLGLLAVGLAPSLSVLVVCTTPLSISSAVARVCSTNITIARTSSTDIGALLGLSASVMSVARMLAPFFGGLAQELSVSGSTYLGAMFATAASLLLVLAPCRKIKAA